MPRRARIQRDLAHYFRIDLAEIGKHAALQEVGKVHRMTWQRQDTIWVKRREYPERMDVTTWVSVRMTRTSHDKLTVLLSSKKGGLGTSLIRHRITLALSVEPNAVGGERLWFRCPDCGGTVRTVHWGGGWLRCRRCAGLRHTTALISPAKRAEHRAERVLRKLGHYGDAWSSPPERPFRMHRKTHTELLSQFVVAANVARDADNRRAARMNKAMWRVAARLQRRLG